MIATDFSSLRTRSDDVATAMDATPEYLAVHACFSTMIEAETLLKRGLAAEAETLLSNRLQRFADSFFPQSGRYAAAPAPDPEPLFQVLTTREIEVMTGVSRAESNKLIARRLNLKPETVKWHLKNIFRKLDARSRHQAIANAASLGLSMAYAPRVGSAVRGWGTVQSGPGMEFKTGESQRPVQMSGRQTAEKTADKIAETRTSK